MDVDALLLVCASAILVILTRRADPDDLLNNRMSSIVGASIHRMSMIDTAADGKLLDYANTHAVGAELGPIKVLS